MNLRKGTVPSLRRPAGLGGVLERWDPGITGARALAVVGLIAALAAAVLLWAGRSHPQPVPPLSAIPDSSDTPDNHPRHTAFTTPPAADPLVVHITGNVRNPGVATLPPGSRVTDAIDAAGGLRKNGRIGTVNLARKLIDGEQINVGSNTPTLPTPFPPPLATDTTNTPLDLNTATLAQLQDLPGVGPVLAQRILDHRTEHGPFRTIDQLQDITGIGDRRFADLKDKVHVPTP